MILVEVLESFEKILFLLQPMTLHRCSDKFDVVDSPVFVNIGLLKVYSDVKIVI